MIFHFKCEVTSMIRFAVIGTNWITEQFLESAKHAKEFKLEGVYSRTIERAQAFAERYQAPLTFSSIQELAENPAIDAVYVASPNSLHAEQAIELMTNGKHVLCEKPLASNVREVKAAIEAATNNKVLLMEAMKTTCLPSFDAIKANLHKLGQIRRYVANFCKVSSRYDAYKQGTILNAFDPTFSNGSLMDLGVYGLFPMITLFGEPESIKANGIMLASGVDGAGTVVAHYEGLEGIVTHSKITDSYLPSEIQGEDGTLIIDKISTPQHLEIVYRNGEREVIEFKQDFPPMYYELEEFIRGIHEGKSESEINTHERSLLTIKVVDEARRQMGLVYPADHKAD